MRERNAHVRTIRGELREDLRTAGITARAGLDLGEHRSWNDAWLDPLATARLLYHAAAYVDDEGIGHALTAAQRPFARPIAVGEPATFAVIEAPDPRTALRLACTGRRSVRDGVVVASRRQVSQR